MSGAAGLAAARRRRAGSVQQNIQLPTPTQNPKPQPKHPMTILYEHEQKINQLLSNSNENQLSNSSDGLDELKEQMNTLEKLLLKLQTKLNEQEDEIKEFKKINLNEND